MQSASLPRGEHASSPPPAAFLAEYLVSSLLAAAAGELFGIFLLRFALQLRVNLARHGIGAQGAAEEKDVWLWPETKQGRRQPARFQEKEGVRRGVG